MAHKYFLHNYLQISYESFEESIKGTRSRSAHARLPDWNLKKSAWLFQVAFTNSRWRRLAEDPDMAVNASTQSGNVRLKTEGNTRKRGWETIGVVIWKNRSLSCAYKQNLMQVMNLSVTANLRLIYCLSNIVEGKTYVHKRLVYIPW